MKRVHGPGSGNRQRGGATLWLGGGIVLVGALAVGAAVGYWLFMNLVINITLKDQPIAIGLPESTRAVAEVTNVLDITLQGEIVTAVPFNEDITIPLKGRYDFHVQMSPTVPVHFTVVYDGIIPVDTMATVQAQTDFNYKTVKTIRNLEFTTRLPLEFKLPVHLEIPVDETIKLKYEGPISATIHEELETRVETTLHATLPVNQTISSPVTAAIPLRVHLPQHPVPAILNAVEIALRPPMLGFGLAEADETDESERLPSPFGPAADRLQR